MTSVSVHELTGTPEPEKVCRNCRWWKQLAHFDEGECGLMDSDAADKPFLYGYGQDCEVMYNTPADWYCKGWQAREEADNA